MDSIDEFETGNDPLTFTCASGSHPEKIWEGGNPEPTLDAARASSVITITFASKAAITMPMIHVLFAAI
jgi:hypothetical protein